MNHSNFGVNRFRTYTTVFLAQLSDSVKQLSLVANELSEKSTNYPRIPMNYPRDVLYESIHLF